MNPGRQDRKVTIERYTVAQDAAGQETRTWSTLRQPWARLLPVRAGKETEDEGEERVAWEWQRFRIRYSSTDITTKDRVQYNGRTWDILEATDIGRGLYTDLVCRTRGDS